MPVPLVLRVAAAVPVPVLLLVLVLHTTATAEAAGDHDGARPRAAGKPNVLFLVADDLRPWLGAYGDKDAYSPNIDALAARSLLFNRSFVQQAVCGPSRISFLTSRRPDTTRLYDFGSYWRTHAGNFTTLPQAFRTAGYEARSFGKVFHPGKPSGGKVVPRNYSWVEGEPATNANDYPFSWSAPPFLPSAHKDKNFPSCLPSVPSQHNGSRYSNLYCPVDPTKEPKGTLSDMQTAEAVEEYLKQRSWGGATPPLFLAVGFHKPHIPLKFPAEYLEHIPSEDQIGLAPDRAVSAWLGAAPGSVAYQPWADVRSRQDIAALDVPFPYGPMPPYYAKKIRRAYLGAVAYMDAQVGRVVAAVKAAGQQDNTIVTFIGDHGWALGEHGEWAKYQVFEVATRIPTLIHVPGRGWPQRGKVTDELFELVDLWPTIAELAGLPAPPLCPPRPAVMSVATCTEGASAARVVLGTATKHKGAAFSQYPRPSLVPQNSSQLPDLADIQFMAYTIRVATHRYTEWRRFSPANYTADWRGAPVATELYDHGTNEGEREDVNLCFVRGQHNQCGTHQTVAAALAKRLRVGWRAELPHE